MSQLRIKRLVTDVDLTTRSSKVLPISQGNHTAKHINRSPSVKVVGTLELSTNQRCNRYALDVESKPTNGAEAETDAPQENDTCIFHENSNRAQAFAI
jgi:hypothetical protein